MNEQNGAGILVDRETLYQEVWSEPGQKLASKHGVSDVALAKACKRHRIPRLSKDYETLVDSSVAMIHITMINLMLHRLEPG